MLSMLKIYCAYAVKSLRYFLSITKSYFMKKIVLLLIILTPILIQAQDLIPYKKAIPKISAKGVVTMPNSQEKITIEGFNDKDVTVFFIVRHAEKDTAGGTNADLNAEGRSRANALVSIFKKIHIHKVYSTDKPRTKNTAKPLAAFKHCPVEIYDAKRQKELLESLIKLEKSKKIFIVGHSNTVPQLVNILRGSDVEKDLADNDYSTMYIVSVKQIGDAKVQVIHF